MVFDLSLGINAEDSNKNKYPNLLVATNDQQALADKWLRYKNILLVCCLSIGLSACSSLKGHNQVADSVLQARKTAGVFAAIEALDATATSESDRKDMLFNLERGELLRSAKRYEDSIQALLKADAVVQEWENDAKSDTSRMFDNILGTMTSDRFRTYEGQDYEKVMLTTMLALDRIAMGDWDTARVDIKRTHEREDVISSAREKELEKTREKAQEDGILSPQMKDLGGYPVELINNKEVDQLKNGYQNALSHYLSGFVYEALGESDLAAQGYKRAIELRPGYPVLQDALTGLSRRSSRSQQNATDVLFLIEAGNIPKRLSIPIIFPLAVRNNKIPVNFALPVLDKSTHVPLHSLGVGGGNLPLIPIVDFQLMAARSLKDEIPGILLRGAIRLAVQGVLLSRLGQNEQKVVQSHARVAAAKGETTAVTKSSHNTAGELGGLLGSVAGAFASGNNSGSIGMGSQSPLSGGSAVVANVGGNILKDLATDAIIGVHQQVDDRMWRMLPERVYLARAHLAPGEYRLRIDGKDVGEPVMIGGRYAVVPLRSFRERILVGQTASRGGVPLKLVEVEAVAPNLLGVESHAVKPDGLMPTSSSTPSPQPTKGKRPRKQAPAGNKGVPKPAAAASAPN